MTRARTIAALAGTAISVAVLGGALWVHSLGPPSTATEIAVPASAAMVRARVIALS